MAKSAKVRSRTTNDANLSLPSKSRLRTTPTSKVKNTASDYISPTTRRKLGGIWARGPDSWPATRIVGERIFEGDKQYKFEWEPHPVTGEAYPPSWEPAENAEDTELVENWTQQKKVTAKSHPRKKTDRQGRLEAKPRSSPAGQRRRANYTRRVLQSSSEAEHTDSLDEPSFPRSPKTRAQRDTLDETLQVPETQEQTHASHPQTVEVAIPPASLNPADYDTIASSPFSHCLLSSVSGSQNPRSQKSLEELPSGSFGPVGAASAVHGVSRLTRFGQRRTHLALRNSIATSPPKTRSTTRSSSSPNSETSLGLSLPERQVTPSTQNSSLESSPLSLTRSFPNQDNSSLHLLTGPPVVTNSVRLSTPQTQVETIEDSQSITVSPQSIAHSANLRSTPLGLRKQRLLKQPLPGISLRLDQEDPHQTGRRTPKRLDYLTRRLPITMEQARETPSARLRTANPSIETKAVLKPSDQAHSARNVSRIANKTRSNHESLGLRTSSPSLVSQALPSWGLEAPAESDPRSNAALGKSNNSSSLNVDTIEPALSSSISPRRTIYDTALGASAMPIQQSIEEDPPESTEISNVARERGRLQIQQSVENQRSVPHSGGFALPTRPILEEAEFAISLPAEGRVQSIYQNAIRAKKKALLKFVRREDLNGSRSQRRTEERNEIAQLISRLNDIVTHIDLGLDDSATQYSLQSEDNARYAPYAGSKFAFLHHLMNHLSGKDCSMVIVSRGDRTQDLLEGYLRSKRVFCYRPLQDSHPSTPVDGSSSKVTVVLLTAWSSAAIDLPKPPRLIIAFDSSFDIQDPLMKSLRNRSGGSPLVPIVHLFVMNSSEHVDACIPQQLPSPQRLRLLARATYQARNNLGGGPSMIPQGDELAAKDAVDLWELQKVVKKSPERRLEKIARDVATAIASVDFISNWAVDSMPDLELDDLDDSPSKSERTRSVTPLSRAGTPTRKRFLEIDNLSAVAAKRQRMTPLSESGHVVASTRDASLQVEPLRKELAEILETLASERKSRVNMEDENELLRLQLNEHVQELSKLNFRYETRMKKNHDLDREVKVLKQHLETRNVRHEKTIADNSSLKEQITELQKELLTARCELKGAGGDIAALELAREEMRISALRAVTVERSLENTRKDFEFTRQQYQEASTKAAELAAQVSELEQQNKDLRVKASDETRRLKEMNFQSAVQAHLGRITELEGEARVRDNLIRKLEEENRVLKKTRSGVQTRGSSVQPPGSPGGAMGPRSRQGSPAPGSSGIGLHSHGHTALPGGRAAVLRHER